MTQAIQSFLHSRRRILMGFARVGSNPTVDNILFAISIFGVRGGGVEHGISVVRW